MCSSDLHDEIAKTRALMDSAPLVTLSGTGGCGKTRLAVEIAYQELPSRPGGCYFADLSAVSDGSELPAALASAVRLEPTGPRNPIDQVMDHLVSRDALLVLDNCEHILADCARFTEALLARSSATAILTTTRQSLGVAGERVVPVPSLEHRAPDSPAVELFVERATAVSPGFAPSGDDLDAIEEICVHLDGNPLAIELAAARLGVLTPREVLDRMADRFRLLSGGRGRRRRRTLQATLDWSFDLLDLDEQVFFRRLGLFVGSFDLGAAVAVSGFDDYEAIDLLESLVAKNLVAVDQTPGAPTTRYRLLETVRIYAADHLIRAGDAGDAHEAHVAHYQSMVATRDWLTAAGLDRALLLHWDWPNIASTLEYLTSEGEWEAAAEMVFGCQGMWETRIPAIEGRRWAELIYPHLAPGELHDWIGFVLASVSLQSDDFVLVHELLSGLSTGATLHPRAMGAGTFAFLNYRQFPERAVQLADLALELADEHDLGHEYRCPPTWSRAALALYGGEVGKARVLFQNAYECSSSLEHHTSHHVLSGLALAATQVLDGEPESALVTLEDGGWSRSIWDSAPIVRGVALIDMGRASEAADLVIGFGFDAVRGRLARMANDALVGLAALALNRGEVERGWKLLQSAATPRTPFTIGLAEGLADRIGHGPALRHMHRSRDVPLSELDGSEALLAELDRLSGLR